jgi:Na+/proline symporter
MESIYYDDYYEDDVRSQNVSKKKVKYRVGFFIGAFLIGLAFVFDVVEAILSLVLAGVGGYIKDFASIILFPILFLIFKIPFWKGNKKVEKISTNIIGFIVALIPFLSDVLPELTISVIITIMYSRIEDKLGIQGNLLQPNPKITRYKRVRPKIRK